MSEPRLALATYNVHDCVGRNGGFDPDRIAAVLLELDADAIALQELHWRPDKALHLLDDFASRLGYTALAGPTLLRERGHYGNAVLSRLPVLDAQRIDLSVSGREPRGAIEAMLDSPHGTVHLIATHLGLKPAERRSQIQQLLARPVPPAAAHVLGLSRGRPQGMAT